MDARVSSVNMLDGLEICLGGGKMLARCWRFETVIYAKCSVVCMLPICKM